MKTCFRNLARILLTLIILLLSSCDDSGLMSNNYLPYQLQPPPKDTKFHFDVFGDSRDGNAVYSHLISLAIAGGPPAFTVHLGDMIPAPTRWEQWPIFKAISAPLISSGKFWVVVGNHDVNDKDSLERLRAAFPYVPETGYYARQNGDCFNIFLNSEDYTSNGISNLQLNWLEQHLIEATVSGDNIPIVYSHQPPFPQNSHIDNPFEDNEAIHSLLVHYKIPLMISAHEHSYSRYERDGVTYVITGGAGSPLHKEAGDAAFYHFIRVYVDDQKLIVRVIGLLGETHDQFEIFL